MLLDTWSCANLVEEGHINAEQLFGLSQNSSWGRYLTIEGLSQSPMSDNIFVLGHDIDGWFLGYQERGELSVISRADSEEAAVQAVLAELQPSRPNLATSFAETRKAYTANITPKGNVDGDGCV